MLQNGWFYERSFHESFSMGWKVKKVLHSEQSKFQKANFRNQNGLYLLLPLL